MTYMYKLDIQVWQPSIAVRNKESNAFNNKNNNQS